MIRSVVLLIGAAFSLMAVNCQSDNGVENQQVKNVILLVGDGMGVAHVYAAMSVADKTLNFERSQYFGFTKTYSASHYTTDSGAGATAMATGIKTYNTAISVDTNKKALKRISDYAKENGLSVGVVATCDITHATPAAFLSHNEMRYNSEEIAREIVNSEVDLVIAGGNITFDTLGLYDTLKQAGYQIQPNYTEIDVESNSRVFSLPYDNHPPSILNGRGDFLPDATSIALQKLSKNSRGFFLLVEGSQIDWAGHNNDIDMLTSEVIDFDKAVGAAYDFADENPGTLVIVTADHETGGLVLTNGSIKDKTIEAVFATKGHSGVMVPLFAYGTGANDFSNVVENTDIFHKIMKALDLYPQDYVKESIMVHKN